MRKLWKIYLQSISSRSSKRSLWTPEVTRLSTIWIVTKSFLSTERLIHHTWQRLEPTVAEGRLLSVYNSTTKPPRLDDSMVPMHRMNSLICTVALDSVFDFASEWVDTFRTFLDLALGQLNTLTRIRKATWNKNLLSITYFTKNMKGCRFGLFLLGWLVGGSIYPWIGRFDWLTDPPFLSLRWISRQRCFGADAQSFI